MLSASYLAWYFVKEDSRIQIRYMVFAIFMFIAIVIDIFWLIWYTRPLWSTKHVDSDSIWVLRRMTVVCSYLLTASEVVSPQPAWRFLLGVVPRRE